tara:strand:- start:73 stop:375 length:303 start_codon:yes stop_codon:yes gene_type:complete
MGLHSVGSLFQFITLGFGLLSFAFKPLQRLVEFLKVGDGFAAFCLKLFEALPEFRSFWTAFAVFPFFQFFDQLSRFEFNLFGTVVFSCLTQILDFLTQMV